VSGWNAGVPLASSAAAQDLPALSTKAVKAESSFAAAEDDRETPAFQPDTSTVVDY